MVIKCKENLEFSKQLICNNQMLQHYDMKKPSVVMCNTSAYGVGSVLSHLIDVVNKPILFAFCTLSKAERNYSRIERETLTIIFGVKRFH